MLLAGKGDWFTVVFVASPGGEEKRKMEPVKQLIQMVTPHHFKPTSQMGDSEESFLAYLGQARQPAKQAGQVVDNEASRLDLSPLAKLIGGLSTEGRGALLDLMRMLPDGQGPPKDLEQILNSLVDGTTSEQAENRIRSLKEVFDRVAENPSNGSLNVSLSLRDLAGITEKSRKYFFQEIDNILNLGSRDLTGFISGDSGLSHKEQEDFLRVLGNLLRRGVVGKEEIRVRDQKRTTFSTTRLGDSRLRRAEPYDRRKLPLRRTG